MGQVLQSDLIGSLSHNSGIITLAASRLTIGGQQYTASSTSRTISTDVTMVANTLYMVFAVIVSGAVQLRISTNFNSTGPAGFTSWKLVGAFYSNGLASVAFGSFVNIEGAPNSGWIQTLLSIKDNNGTGVSVLSVAPQTSQRRWKRQGQQLMEEFGYYQNATLGIAGSGVYGLNPPTNLSYDFTNLSTGGGNSSNLGKVVLDIGGSNSFRQGEMGNASPNLTLNLINADGTKQSMSSSFASLNTNLVGFGGRFELPAVGWSDTPLKDL